MNNSRTDNHAPFKAEPGTRVSTTFKVIGSLVVAGFIAGIYGENLRGKLERLNEQNLEMQARQSGVEAKVDGLRDSIRDMAAEQKTYLKYLVDRKGPKPSDENP